MSNIFLIFPVNLFKNIEYLIEETRFYYEYLQNNYSTSRQVSHRKKKSVSNQHQIINEAQNIIFSQ